MNIESGIMGIKQDSLLARIAELEAENAALKAQVEQLRQETMLDAMLPVYNRRAFRRELERTIALLDRYDIGSALLYLDIDAFKAINDDYGHAAGDAVLSLVAQTLLQTVRVSDTVGRLGGDEFAIALIQSDEVATLAKIKAIKKAFEGLEVQTAKGETIQFSISIGYTVLVRGDDTDQALERADAAMYAQKRKRS